MVQLLPITGLVARLQEPPPHDLPPRGDGRSNGRGSGALPPRPRPQPRDINRGAGVTIFFLPPLLLLPLRPILELSSVGPTAQETWAAVVLLHAGADSHR
jgi:hypothetical protein